MSPFARIGAAWRPEWSRWIAYAAVAFCVLFTLFALSRQAWVMSDGLTYQDAAERLRNGGQLYIEAEIGERSYRYAPWFAYMWLVVPFPDQLWISAMTVCSAVAVIPVARTGWLGVALGALVFPYLLVSAMGGHVQPALIAALAWGVGTRWGPITIALVASLKVTPILFALTYLARREWLKLITTIVVTGGLVVPFLFFDLTYFPTDTAGAWGLFEWSPVLWGVIVLGVVAYAMVFPSWSATSLLVTLAIPKFVYYDVSYLVVGRFADRQERSRGIATVDPERDIVDDVLPSKSRGQQQAT